MAIESINPSTGERIKRYEETGASRIEESLEGARKAFADWRRTGFDERAVLMARTAEILRRNARGYGEIITAEMGKPIREAKAEVEKCATVCDFYAENAERMLSVDARASDASKSYVRYDPLGPVLAVMPWNFPFWQVFRFAAPALMAGNVGVLKHASNVPGSALAIEEVFREAGFPTAVFTTLLISARTTAEVIRDPRIVAATLTGSGPAGGQVASLAGGLLKKTVLELGGSDPFIVLSDANIEKAAEIAALSRTINTGQSCIAAKRFIVVEEVAGRFSKELQKKLADLVVGDPMDEQTDLGPMARADLRDELHDQVERTVNEGARLVMGGDIPKGRGFYYPVTLLSEVTPEMPAAQEETFGPAAALIVVKGEDEAIEVANNSSYGLGASLWTRDFERAHSLAERIESGAVFVNGLVKSDPRLPFGGIKQSGYGRELSQEGIREFVNTKTVWMTS